MLNFFTKCPKKAANTLAGLSLVFVLFLSQLPSACADVTAFGDVDPDTDPLLPIFGGTIAGPVRVGIDAPGRLTFDGPSFTAPLISADATIGVNSNGIGEVEIAGFGSEWTIDQGNFIVGDAGQGFLLLVGGAIASTTDTSGMSPVTAGSVVIGQQAFSQGVVSVDGFGSLLLTADVVVGENGFATLDILNRGSLRTETTKIGNLPDSIGRVTLTGLGTRWFSTEQSNNDFVVGEEGRATLEILDQAIVFNARNVTIGRLAGSSGKVTVSGAGSLWQIDDNNGTDDLDVGGVGLGELHIADSGLVRVDGTTTVSSKSFVELSSGGILNSASVVNNGVIRGAGRIESNLTLSATGELRNAAGISSLREYMLVTGTVTNNGTIESLGGEMEFQSVVTNNLDMVARDAIVRFQSGLTNNASLEIGGATTIFGPVSGPGDIHVLSGSEALIVGDLTLSASSVLNLSIGDAPGTLDVLGLTDISGALLTLNYSAGVAAQAGDSYQVFASGDGLTGMFSNTTVPAGGLLWDISYSPLVNPTSVIVTAGTTIVPNILGDFDGSNNVDGIDFLTWQRGFGTPPTGVYDANDLADWESAFGTTALPLVAAATVGAIPEPSALALLLLGSVLIAGRRSRDAS